MHDREKVIETVKDIENYCFQRYKEAPFEEDSSGWLDWSNALSDALAMLKEQQTEIEDLRTAMQSMIEGQCVIAGNKQQPKTGRWKCHGEPPMLVVECSECGQKFFNHAMQTFANYCSMCGAKMDDSSCVD